MTAYEKVMAARDANKLASVDFIAHMFGDSFIELHGDRRYADDKAVVAGLAMLFDTPVTVIGIEKGRNTKERVPPSLALCFSSLTRRLSKKYFSLLKKPLFLQKRKTSLLKQSGKAWAP